MQDDLFIRLKRYAIHFFLFIQLFIVCGASEVYAHKVYIFAWAEGDTVYTESYSGDRKVKEGIIKVFTVSGDKILEGKTNKDGLFSFKIPEKTSMKIVLEAGQGHRAEYLLKADDLSSSVNNSLVVDPPETASSKSPELSLEEDRFKSLFEETLDNRLQPISRRLARIEATRNPGVTEIFGGIGYIIGIMGLVLYFKNKKNKKG